MWMVAGKVATSAADKVGFDKQRRRKLLLFGGLGLGALGAGVAMLVSVVLIAVLGAISGNTVANAVIVGNCGVNRAPITIAPDNTNSGGSLTNVVPGSLVVPMAAGTYVISSGFGMRWGAMHDGQDFAAPVGTPIYAAGDGEVVAAGPASGYGFWIRIRHVIDGHTVETLYGHMPPSSIQLAVGDHVKAGQQIAVVGKEGNSTGPHLHFGVYPIQWSMGGGVDPMPWLKQESTANSTTAVTTPTRGPPANPAGGPSSTAGPTPTSAAPNSPVAQQPTTQPASQPATCGQPQTHLNSGKVPAKYVDAVLNAGKVCPEVTSVLIAAQIDQESSWNPDAVSKGDDVNQGGAQGMSQFMPGTWKTWGVDSGLNKDGKPNGSDAPDPFNPFDAIASQAKYDCYFADKFRAGHQTGELQGDIIDLILAGYNAGESAVFKYHKVPPFPQTVTYVARIKELMQQYGALNGNATANQAGSAQPFTVAGSAFAQAMITAASSQIGLPYVWGGGNAAGPTTGTGGSEIGFDCSGLVLYAVAQASHGSIILPHLTTEQAKQGTKVAVADIQPGDAILSNGFGHISIWMGDGKVLEAADFGIPVAVHSFDLSHAEEIRRFGT